MFYNLFNGSKFMLFSNLYTYLNNFVKTLIINKLYLLTFFSNFDLVTKTPLPDLHTVHCTVWTVKEVLDMPVK